MVPENVLWATRAVYTHEEVTTVSDATGQFRDPRRRGNDAEAFPLPGLSRADLILALIPLAFAIALVAAATTPLALDETLAIASLLGLAGIVESVVLNPPIHDR